MRVHTSTSTARRIHRSVALDATPTDHVPLSAGAVTNDSES